MTPFILEQVNCPTNCPTVKFSGQSITYKVKRKTDYVRKDGTCSIYIQCFVNGEQVRIPVDDLSAADNEWNDQKARFKGRSQKATDGNLIIDDYLKRIHEISVKVRLGESTLTKENFVEQVLNYATRTDFLIYWRWKLNQRKGEISYETHRLHGSCINSVEKFCKTLPFHHITNEWVRKYKIWMRKKGLGENTMATKIKVLKTYLNMARKQDGFKFKFPTDELKGRTFEPKIAFLTQEELKRAMELYDDYLLPDHLRNTLQYFLFSCFTAVRFSDVKALTRENIIGDYLVYVPQKTKKKGKTLKIKLSKNAKRYINPTGPLFTKVITNIKTNESLKIIQRMIGCKTRLSFHMSRHTFATQFLELGGTVETLQKILDHANIRETMGYVHVTDKRKDDQMDNMDKL